MFLFKFVVAGTRVLEVGGQLNNFFWNGKFGSLKVLNKYEGNEYEEGPTAVSFTLKMFWLHFLLLTRAYNKQQGSTKPKSFSIFFV